MIARLVGIPVMRSPGRLVIDVGGVGYEVLISKTTFEALPPAGSVTLHVQTHVRESQIALFGFADGLEKRMFVLLQSVAGIGPRLALAILSGLPSLRLAAVLSKRDLARLVAIPGVGKRTAERMITELHEKMSEILPEGGQGGGAPKPDPLRSDARLALLNLGYGETAVQEALDQVLLMERGQGPRLQDVLKASLQVLSRR
ncbi:MAG: Holliday junction branch migration protein RuvA [Acidobacteriota bacterium]